MARGNDTIRHHDRDPRALGREIRAPCTEFERPEELCYLSLLQEGLKEVRLVSKQCIMPLDGRRHKPLVFYTSLAQNDTYQN